LTRFVPISTVVVSQRKFEERIDVFGTSTRVLLMGNTGTPDILIARADENGRDLARDLATTLRLPFEDAHVPYGAVLGLRCGLAALLERGRQEAVDFLIGQGILV
jgi:hypothetical protein